MFFCRIAALPAFGIVFLSVSSLLASDLLDGQQPINATAAPSVARDWSSFYFGAHLLGATSSNFTSNSSNAGFGFHAGYLQQNDAFVVGGEVEATLNDAILYDLGGVGSVSQGWSAAAKFRAGLAYGDVLLYGTAGLGITQFKSRNAAIVGSDYSYGPSIGGGAEYFVTDTVSVRAEYLQTHYVDFKSTVAGVARADQLVTRAITFGVSNHF